MLHLTCIHPTHPGKVSSSAIKNGRSAIALEKNQALLKELSSINEKTIITEC